MAELSPELAQATANVVVALADNKYFLAHRLAAWGVGAPTLESAVACTAIAQEEAGHARGLYSLLEDFPREVAPLPLERESDRERKYALSYLARADDVLRPRGRRADARRPGLHGRCSRPRPTRASKGCGSGRVRILADERFHQRFADGRLRELARTRALEHELARCCPETLCWFGPDGEPGLDLLVGAGDPVAAQRGAAADVPRAARRGTGSAGIELPDRA